MKLHIKQGFINQEETELIVVNLFQGVKEPSGATKAVDGALGGLISQILADGDFDGKLGKTHLLYSRGSLPAPRALITGLGPAEEFNLERCRLAAAAAARRVCELGVQRFSTILHGAGQGGLEPDRAAQAVVEGSMLGAYRFSAHKRDQQETKAAGAAEMTIVEADSGKLAAIEAGAQAGHILADSANFARDLSNEPGNLLTPRELARRIKERAEGAGLQCQVFGEAEMESLGAGSFLGIARGSEEEAQFILLEHTPAGFVAEGVPTIVLVGKAITFDSGGISLKPGEDMWRMKNDMGGGAAVAAALIAAARLNLPVHAVGIIPATENMPSGRAIKPGDILRAMNGKTIEIISTDAEGRQVLADGLCYAARYEPTAVVDVATLTGSIGLALGREMAGLFCEDDDLRSRLMQASELAGEPLWPMPLYQPYRKLIDSQVADIKNSGGRWGGAIIAALFLREFAEGYPWAHLDIASTTWLDSSSPYFEEGGTGFSARLLVELLRGYST